MDWSKIGILGPKMPIDELEFGEQWKCDQCGNDYFIDFHKIYELGDAEAGWFAVCGDCYDREQVA